MSSASQSLGCDLPMLGSQIASARTTDRRFHSNNSQHLLRRAETQCMGNREVCECLPNSGSHSPRRGNPSLRTTPLRAAEPIDHTLSLISGGRCPKESRRRVPDSSNTPNSLNTRQYVDRILRPCAEQTTALRRLRHTNQGAGDPARLLSVSSGHKAFKTVSALNVIPTKIAISLQFLVKSSGF